VNHKQMLVTVCCLKIDELELRNIFAANKVIMLCSVALFYYVRWIILLKVFSWPRAACWSALLYLMGLIDSPLYRRCGAEEEDFSTSFVWVWSFCNTQAYLFGFFFLNPDDVRNVGLGQSGTLLKGQGFRYLISA